MARDLDQLIAWRGRPATIVSGNGSESTSDAILCWAEERGVEWHSIASGKPVQSAFTENVIGRFGDEYLREPVANFA